MSDDVENLQKEIVIIRCGGKNVIKSLSSISFIAALHKMCSFIHKCIKTQNIKNILKSLAIVANYVTNIQYRRFSC